MKNKIINFLRTRYGIDQFSGFLTWGGIAFMLVGGLTKIGVIYYIGMVLFIWGYFRILSKNHAKRAAENAWFLNKTAGIRAGFKRLKKNKQAGKDHKVYSCKNCHQMIRVPKGRGKIEIRCPKCGNKFIKKT